MVYENSLKYLNTNQRMHKGCQGKKKEFESQLFENAWNFDRVDFLFSIVGTVTVDECELIEGTNRFETSNNRTLRDPFILSWNTLSPDSLYKKSWHRTVIASPISRRLKHNQLKVVKRCENANTIGNVVTTRQIRMRSESKLKNPPLFSPFVSFSTLQRRFEHGRTEVGTKPRNDCYKRKR